MVILFLPGCIIKTVKGNAKLYHSHIKKPVATGMYVDVSGRIISIIQHSCSSNITFFFYEKQPELEVSVSFKPVYYVYVHEP